jgi:hypothetical protein
LLRPDATFRIPDISQTAFANQAFWVMARSLVAIRCRAIFQSQ